MREPHVVRMEELFQGILSRPFDLCQRWPAANEVANQYRIQMLKPLEHLRIILFQRAAQLIGDAGLVIDQVSPLLNQADQRAHLNTLRL